MEHRGSRRHVLEWLHADTFIDEFNGLLAPANAHVSASDTWQPNRNSPVEAKLSRWGPEVMAGTIDWPAVSVWWLKHGGNTPNWDLVATATVHGRRGIVLVEAKANTPELSAAGKRTSKKKVPSKRSLANSKHIAAALEEARLGLSQVGTPCRFGIDSHYQFANRLAFAWKLACQGLPTVLLYLGFIGDRGIRHHFPNAAAWTETFKA